MSTTLSNTESFLCGCLLLIQKPLVNLIFESVGDDESVFFFGFSLEFWDFCDMEESKTNDVDVIKRSMSDEAFDEAVKLTRSALESQEVDKDVAEHIKTRMEKKFHGSWYVFFRFESLTFISNVHLIPSLLIHLIYLLIILTISNYICYTGIVSSEKISVVPWSSIRWRCAHTRSLTKAYFCFEVRKLIEFK